MTEVYFPAKDIAEACKKVLHEIEDHRDKILVKLVNERFRKWHWKFKPPSKEFLAGLKYTLPFGDREIAYMHRSDEENKVTKILHISQGAVATDEELRVRVSVDDFSLIYEHYEANLRKKIKC